MLNKPINEIRISGRTTRDVVIKKVAVGDSAKTMAFFDIAQTLSSKDKKTKRSMFFHCIAWDDIAEELAALPKGSEIVIEKGVLMTNIYKKGNRTYTNTQISIREYSTPLKNKIQAANAITNELEEAEELY